MTRILTRTRFGLPPDPWSGLTLETIDAKRASELIRAAVAAQLMISLVGQRGSGKTRALRTALRDLNVQLVEPLRLDRERLHLGDIEAAIVQELSDESPRRSGEARSHQVRRVLGEASRNRPVVLVLDDAHQMHRNTLRGLKRLRELSWLSQSPLLGIVLIGQSDKAGDVPEVGLRSDSLQLAGLTHAEAGQALIQALNRKRTVVEPEAVETLAASPWARNWLDLQCAVDACLAEAAARGEDTITAAAVGVVLGTRQAPAVDVEAPEPEDVPDDAAVAELLSKTRTRKSA